MQVNSGQSGPVRVYVGPSPGNPRANAVAVRVLVAWADFFRVPLQCFVAEPARHPRDNCGELLNSDMYVAFAEEDAPAFLAEWHMAAALSIPAFGYANREATSSLQPQPRVVHGLPNFSSALAADLVNYSNRGFSRVDHHASLRTVVAADPVLLCLVLAGLDGRDFRRVCSRLNFRGRGGRLIMCREVMRDASERHRETVTQSLESEIPTIFGSLAGTAGRVFFPFQASAYLFEAPSPRLAEAAPSEVRAVLPVSIPPVSDDLEIPGEAGKWVKDWKDWKTLWNRSRWLAVFLLLVAAVWLVREPLAAQAAKIYEEYHSEQVAKGLYVGAWPKPPSTEVTWTLNYGNNRETFTGTPQHLRVEGGSLLFSYLGDKVFGDYFTNFGIVLNHDQRYVAWIARGKLGGDYYAIEYLFPTSFDTKTGFGKGAIQGCLYQANKLVDCAPHPGFEFAPLRNGDILRVLMTVKGNLATTQVILERHPPIEAQEPDFSYQPQTAGPFRMDSALTSGLFGFRSDSEQPAAGKVRGNPARPGFSIIDFSLDAAAKGMAPFDIANPEPKAEAPPK
jgi:hypothetical protein